MHRTVSRLLLLSLACLLLAPSTGCVIARIDAKGTTPVLLNNPPQRVEVIKHFEVSQGIMFDYTSAFDASDILAQVLSETQCDAIVNVGLRVEITPGDYCINTCTLNLANAKHLTVVGDAVKTPSGLGMNFEDGEVLGESADFKEVSQQLFALSEVDLSRYHIVRHGDRYRLVRLGS